MKTSWSAFWRTILKFSTVTLTPGGKLRAISTLSMFGVPPLSVRLVRPGGAMATSTITWLYPPDMLTVTAVLSANWMGLKEILVGIREGGVVPPPPALVGGRIAGGRVP